MDDILLRAHIDINGNIIYQPDHKALVSSFKKGNLLKDLEVSLKIVDSPKHWQYKYLYGNKLVKGGIGLYHSIGMKMGENDITYLDWVCKRRFLFEPVDGFKDIPKKYRSNCQVIEKENEIVGYVKAKRDLTYKKMRVYIEQCEDLLFSELQGNMSKESLELRDKAFDIKDQNEMFDKEVDAVKYDEALEVDSENTDSM